MAGEQRTRVLGLPELKTALAGIAPKLRRQVLRNALAAAGRVVRDAARRSAPVLSSADRRAPYRTPGTLRKAITVRTSKRARRAGDVVVFVNVRPAKGGARGARTGRDPFYWRFVEFGTRAMQAVPFLQVGAAKLDEALEVFKARIGPAIEKLNTKRLP